MRRAANMQDYYVAREYLIGLIDLASLGDKPAVHAPLIPPATTDADGRFTLKGVGRDRVAELYIDGVPGQGVDPDPGSQPVHRKADFDYPTNRSMRKKTC